MSPNESNGEIPTNYTRKYAETRGWKEWEVVREFVQNSLDATGSVAIKKTIDGMLITDKGKGFNALNLLMGTTSKSECDRGRFGEGMKIACLAALNLGYEVEINTDSMHITPIFKLLEIEEPSGGVSSAEILTFKYHKISPVGGTKVFIKGYTQDTFEDRFNLESNKKVILKKEIDICENKNYPSYILDEPVKRIYVRNIYVQDIEEKEALFSYDLFDVKLSTDRNIPNARDIHTQIGRLWSCVNSKDLIEKFFKHVQAEGYEEEARLSSNLMRSTKSEHAWKSTFKKLYGDAFLKTSNEMTRLAEYNTHFLRKGVVFPMAIRLTLESIGIQRDYDVLEAIKRVLPRAVFVTNPIQQDNFEYMRRIHIVLKEKHYSQLKQVYLASRDTMIDSEGKALDDNIYIREDRADTMVHMIDVYGHEATHIAFPELHDNTSDFYSKIGQVMAIITKVVVQEKIRVPPNVVW